MFSSWGAGDRSSSTSPSALWATTGAAVALGASYYWYSNYRKTRNNKVLGKPSDLYRNSSAGASNVLRVYKDQIPGKTYVVTGATSGLGQHLAQSLAEAGACVIVGVRNVKAGQQAVAVTPEVGASGGSVHVLELDLSLLDSTRRFAQAVMDLLKSQKIAALDGLVNNAGIFGVAGTTIEGYQTTWQTNCLSPALLTDLLLPVLSETGRIVHVSSKMHRMVLREVSNYIPPTTDGSGAWDYALSKACQIVHAHALNLRFAADKSDRRAVAIEPGVVETRIARHKGEWIQFMTYNLIGTFLLRTTDQGCSSMAFCLLAPPEDLDPDGSLSSDSYYYGDCAPKAVGRRFASVQQAEALSKRFDDIFQKSAKS